MGGPSAPVNETTYIPVKDARASIDCVSVVPSESGERVELTLTLCVELQTALARVLAMLARAHDPGAVGRAGGWRRG